MYRILYIPGHDNLNDVAPSLSSTSRSVHCYACTQPLSHLWSPCGPALSRSRPPRQHSIRPKSVTCQSELNTELSRCVQSRLLQGVGIGAGNHSGVNRKPVPSSRPPWLNLFKATAQGPHSFQPKLPHRGKDPNARPLSDATTPATGKPS